MKVVKSQSYRNISTFLGPCNACTWTTDFSQTQRHMRIIYESKEKMQKHFWRLSHITLQTLSTKSNKKPCCKCEMFSGWIVRQRLCSCPANYWNSESQHSLSACELPNKAEATQETQCESLADLADMSLVHRHTHERGDFLAQTSGKSDQSSTCPKFWGGSERTKVWQRTVAPVLLVNCQNLKIVFLFPVGIVHGDNIASKWPQTVGKFQKCTMKLFSHLHFKLHSFEWIFSFSYCATLYLHVCTCDSKSCNCFGHTFRCTFVF